ncbi:MAG: subtilisin family serine protease, partial [Myxococcota bacterium]
MLLLLSLLACAPTPSEDVFIDADVEALLRGEGPATLDALVTLRSPGPIDRDLGRWRRDVGSLQDAVAACGAVLTQRYAALPLARVTLDRVTAESLLACPVVAGLETPPEMVLSLADSVPLVGADVAHTTYGFDGTGFSVAVIDTGVDYLHPELGGCVPGIGCKVIAGLDFVDDDGDPMDCNGHGTHVAATAAGTRGVAPGADIVAFRVQGGCSGSLDAFAIADSLDWIATNGRTVNVAAVNMSFGNGADEATPCDAFSSAYDAALDTVSGWGHLLVAASGNDSHPSGVSYPACKSNVVAVANSRKDDTIAASSNGGALVDVAAPGTDITAAGVTMSGTSMAAPHVAGAAAVLSGAGATDLRAALTATDAWVTDGAFTYPRLDLEVALRELSAEDGTITQANLTFTPLGLTVGARPAEVRLGGHPLPIDPPYTDSVPVTTDITDYVYDLRHAIVSVHAVDDQDWFLRDVSIADVDGAGRLDLAGAPGPGDAPPWLHGGTRWGDQPWLSAVPGTSASALSIELVNVWAPDAIELRVNGAPVPLDPAGPWGPGGTHTVDVTGFVTAVGGNRISVVAQGGLDAFVGDVVLTSGLTDLAYVPAAAGPFDDPAGSHFGDSLRAPDLPFVTFVDPEMPPISLEFTALGFSAPEAGTLVVNGGSVRLPDQRWPTGERVSVDVTGLVGSAHRSLVSWITADDGYFGVGDLVLIDERTGNEVPYGVAPMGDEVEGGPAVVADGLITARPGRTWFSLDRTGPMRIVSRRLALDRGESVVGTLPWPDGMVDCVPFVSWEKVIEHGDDQCDFHTTFAAGARTTDYAVHVEHCGYGHFGSTVAAQARVTLFCYPEEGWVSTARVDTWVDTPGVEPRARVPWPTAADHAVPLCTLASLDGNGDIDTGAGCTAERAGAFADVQLTMGCHHDDKEYAQADLLALGLPADVEAHVVDFAGEATVTHPYVPRPGDDHLAFVIPQAVDTNCKDHGSFESSC